MMSKRIAIAIAALFIVAPALADDATPDNEGGRYTFSKVAEGFVRLDNQTGQVALCGRRTVGWACEAMPEDRAVLENEIARLRTENAALKKDLLSRGLPLPAGAMPEPPVTRNGDRALRWPGDADFSRMMALLGRMWHRLVEGISRGQREAPDKS